MIPVGDRLHRSTNGEPSVGEHCPVCDSWTFLNNGLMRRLNGRLIVSFFEELAFSPVSSLLERANQRNSISGQLVYSWMEKGGEFR
jgi:hypothetical protein